MIGLLTEAIGNPTPMQIPFSVNKQLPKGDYLEPIAPQTWHFRQSIEYSLTANRSVLDYASRHREQLLFDIWLWGIRRLSVGIRIVGRRRPRWWRRRRRRRGGGLVGGGTVGETY